MKMTDAEAFDFLTPKDGPTIEQEAAIEHLRARLAADQQKGGGECQHEWVPDVDCVAWVYCDKCKCSRRTPQPSIPAPAQQDGKASGGEATVPACRRCGSTNLKNVSTKGGEGKSCVECGNFRFNGPEDAR